MPPVLMQSLPQKMMTRAMGILLEPRAQVKEMRLVSQPLGRSSGNGSRSSKTQCIAALKSMKTGPIAESNI